MVLVEALQKPIETNINESEEAAEAAIFLKTETIEFDPQATHTLPELIITIKRLEKQGRLIGQLFNGKVLIIEYLPEEDTA